MTEKEEAVEEFPKLDPRYQPATEDSRIQIIFQGNTARIHDIQFFQVDAFQMLAIAEYLRYRGLGMIAQTEAQAMQEAMRRAERDRIAIAGRIPEDAEIPDIMKPGGGRH